MATYTQLIQKFKRARPEARVTVGQGLLWWMSHSRHRLVWPLATSLPPSESERVAALDRKIQALEAEIVDVLVNPQPRPV